MFCALVNGEGEVTDFLRLPHFTKRRNAWREEEREKKVSLGTAIILRPMPTGCFWYQVMHCGLERNSQPEVNIGLVTLMCKNSAFLPPCSYSGFSLQNAKPELVADSVQKPSSFSTLTCLTFLSRHRILKP